ncbi:MAG: hydrolase [Bacteroidales bacterium]|nr:hydrolase [Bacteroidales bacterium]
MKILRENSAAIVIDIQEKLFPHMQEKDELLQNCLKLIEGIRLLEVPIIVTQQYTKGLGMTVTPVKEKLPDSDYIEKISFSCFDEPRVREKLESINKKYIIICGIETHVCVLQTSIDLIAGGFIPVVVEDCVSSRNLKDKRIALERIRQEGGIITTMESILFELTRRAGDEVFKKISGIIK